MNNIKNFGIILKNNKGIVSKITRKIYEKECNIINSNMCKLGNHFAIDISIDYRKEINIDEIIENLDSDSCSDNSKKSIIDSDIKELKVSCADNSGIISTASEILYKKNCEIIKLNSNVIPAPITCTPIFNLNIEFYTEKNNELEDIIKKKLEKYNCEIEFN